MKVVREHYRLEEGAKSYGGTVTVGFMRPENAGDFSVYDAWKPVDNPIYRNAAEAAFNQWEAATGLDFVEVEWSESAPTPDIRIWVGTIDGQYGVLGQAWPESGHIELDEAEFLLIGDTDATPNARPEEVRLFHNTLLHEVGHVLGLAHSDVEWAVMSGGDTKYILDEPFYLNLSADDLAGARALYGEGGRPNDNPFWTTPVDTPPGEEITPMPSPPEETPSSVVPGTYENIVVGTRGDDRLYGTSANDVLSGGSGEDLLAGGEGNDLLLGGHEGSTLFGEEGADIFVFTGGSNWFMDFDVAEGDRIGGVPAADAIANGQMLQVGEHLAVYFGDSPWSDEAEVIWLAETVQEPTADWFLV